MNAPVPHEPIPGGPADVPGALPGLPADVPGGSDLPGLPADPLRAAVAVMDRLYSPGGCPWDREQTHLSLVRYLLEESHELAEAIETGDRPGMREELGDVLLQVLFHARIAADESEPFTVDDVAGDLVAKLVRRHPHVFAEAEAAVGMQVSDVHTQWEAIKREEKQRSSVLEGIPLAQGALARAQKVVSRARRSGFIGSAEAGPTVLGPPSAPFVPHAAIASPMASQPAGPATPVASVDPAPTPAVRDAPGPGAGETAEEALGAALLDLVRQADAAGVDAEGALRHALRGLEAVVLAAERAPGAEEEG